jgi:lipoprotein-anchoring transpeptidase ErfK/SrfK
VTDLATRPGAEEAPADGSVDELERPDLGDAEPEAGSSGDLPQTPIYAWAPAEPAPKKSRKALWISLGAGAAAVALVLTSLVTIAPGTTVGGVPVGLMTAGAATDALTQRLAATTVVLTGAGGDAEVTGADLGASIDAKGLAEAAFADNPTWNVTAWFPEPVDAIVQIDAETAASALRAAAPELYTDPVDATLAFDAAAATYVTTPAVDGTGIDVDAVRTALAEAFAAGETRVEFDPVAVPVTATTPTYVADSTAAMLNRMIATAGFYIGSERTVPVTPAVASSWLTVTPGERGTYAIAADEAAIQAVVDTLPAAVNREVQNATVITDSAGDVLREVSAGASGRELGATDDIAADFAAQLATGNAVYQLPVTEVEFATTALERRIEVDLGAQRAYLFENDTVVFSYAISGGLSATPTPTGNFRVFAHVPIQDMGCVPGYDYCTEDVPWVVYFAPDIAFHGAYWHNNFGNPMSHGCVNLPVDTARFVYDWSPYGMEVWVHA